MVYMLESTELLIDMLRVQYVHVFTPDGASCNMKAERSRTTK